MKPVRHVSRQIDRWLHSAGGHKPPAVVMGGSVNGLSFARSLGRRGIPVLLLDSDRLIGTYTRYATFLSLPAVEDHASDWLDLLDYVGGRLASAGVVFPTSDVHVDFVARHADPLRRHYRFIVCPADAMERIINKQTQYRTAEAAGIPIPKTYFPGSTDAVREIAGEVPFPCILKPYKSHVGRKKITKKVIVVESADALVREFARIGTGDAEFMIQEIIPGEDRTLFGYLGFWDEDGHERAWLTKQKLRQNPPHYGDGSLQVTVDAPEVVDLSRRLLKALDYRGFVGVEFKWDARDCTYRLMEINPRTVSGNQLAITAGVDFPWLGYRYLTETHREGVEPASAEPNTKYVNEEWDLKAFLALRKAGQLTLGEWLRSLRGARARAILAWDDPRPAAVVGWRFAKALIWRH